MAKQRNIAQRKENITGYAFITPYVLLFLVFTGIPFICSIVFSFTNMTYISKLANLKFIGFANFIKMFQSPEVMAALGRTFIYSLVYVPAIMVAGFVLAMIVNKGIHWKGAIRGMLFLPYVSNMVAVAVVFKILLGQSGPFYQIMQFLGVENPPLLLLSDKFALPTVALIAVWKGVGLNMIT